MINFYSKFKMGNVSNVHVQDLRGNKSLIQIVSSVLLTVFVLVHLNILTLSTVFSTDCVRALLCFEDLCFGISTAAI